MYFYAYFPPPLVTCILLNYFLYLYCLNFRARNDVFKWMCARNISQRAPIWSEVEVRPGKDYGNRMCGMNGNLSVKIKRKVVWKIGRKGHFWTIGNLKDSGGMGMERDGDRKIGSEVGRL